MEDKFKSFYTPFPKKYVIGQFTFVEPNLSFKLPPFQCCLSHTVEPSIVALPTKINQSRPSYIIDNEPPPVALPKKRDQTLPFYIIDDEPSFAAVPSKTNQLRPSHTIQNEPSFAAVQNSISFLSVSPPPDSNLMAPKSEIEHEDMDQFILSDQGNKSGYWLSFIRPNLVFDVLPKSLPQFRKVISHFQSIYPNGSGIIFCMSKKECDSVTDMVTGALPYHMDLPDLVRAETQRRWEQNEIKVLCATVAFGKTVNKSNVRFVIHHTLPQSLEQYERQCALAGTDGQLSHCVLFYSFNDHLRVLRLILEDIPKPPPKVLAMKESSLRNVLRYCENVTECRRKKLAACFGEKYSAEQCLETPGPCTICEALMDGKQPLKLYDFTGESLAIFSSMGMLRNVVLSYVADLFRGCLTKKKVKNTVYENKLGRLPLFGLGNGLTETDCHRLLQKLVIDDYLNLRLINTKHGTVIGYVNLASKGSTLLNRYRQQENVPPNERIYLHVSDAKEKRRSSKGHNTTDLDDDLVNKRKRLSSVY